MRKVRTKRARAKFAWWRRDRDVSKIRTPCDQTQLKKLSRVTSGLIQACGLNVAQHPLEQQTRHIGAALLDRGKQRPGVGARSVGGRKVEKEASDVDMALCSRLDQSLAALAVGARAHKVGKREKPPHDVHPAVGGSDHKRLFKTPEGGGFGGGNVEDKGRREHRNKF